MRLFNPRRQAFEIHNDIILAAEMGSPVEHLRFLAIEQLQGLARTDLDGSPFARAILQEIWHQREHGIAPWGTGDN